MLFEEKYTSASEKYSRVKLIKGYSGIMVRVSPYNEENAKEAELLIERICPLEIDHIREGDFLLLAQNSQYWKNKLEFFLKKFSTDGKMYSVAADELDTNESFQLFYKRIKRHVGAVEISNKLQNR